MKLIEYPKYLIVFADEMVPNTHALKRPLRKYDTSIDLAEFIENGKTNHGEIRYNLIGVISHHQTDNYVKSDYITVVKRRLFGIEEKQWIKFHQYGELLNIDESEVLNEYPAQVLFYSMPYK